MAVCSFIGDMDLYDLDMYPKVCAAINGIVAENSEVKFLFYPFNKMEAFMNICLRAALEAKSHFSQKVTIALVLDEAGYEKFQEQDSGSLPYCVIDRVILPFTIPSERSDHVNHYKKIQRWMIQESTHVLSYLYRQFFRAENQLLDYAKSRSITIIDLTDRDTEYSIDENIALLSEKERRAIQIIQTGHTRKEVETSLGISSTRVSQILTQSGRTLRKYAKKRLIPELFQRREQPPLICSILPMENITPEGILSFLYTSMFLNGVYGPIQFRIYGDEDKASFSRLLKLFAEFISVSKISRNCSRWRRQ